MKKFIFTLLISLFVIVLVDILFGFACRYLNTNAKGGDTYTINYIANEANEDMIISGSSRAIHHYLPSILLDSLNMSCYNMGRDGNGIIAMYGRLLMITSRYSPKVVVHEITYGFDIEENDNHKYLDVLKRHYDNVGVDEIFASVDEKECIKMYSNLYRFNTSFIQMMSSNIVASSSTFYGGYKPLFGKLDYEPKQSISNNKEVLWDPIKKNCFIKFVELCKEKNIKLYFAISPSYGASNTNLFAPVLDFCKENNIPLLNHYCDSAFIYNKDFFVDPSHLNDDGAKSFTKKIASEIKTLLKK